MSSRSFRCAGAILAVATLLHAQAQGAPDSASATDSLPAPRSTPSPVASSSDSTHLVPWKLGVVGLASVTAGIAAYGLILNQGWWSQPGNHFHWEKPSNDFHYAHNLDKAGHFYFGLWLGEGFRDAYQWAGMSELPSYAFAALSAGSTHLGMEIKDGLAPDWGFSVWDVTAGTLGGLYPMAQRYVPVPFAYVDIKESYWQNSRAYLDSKVEPNVHIWPDDYVNETFWASIKVHKALPGAAKPYWPAWLAVAFGAGIDGKTFIQNYAGTNEFYVAPDWDLEALFHPKSALGKRVVHYANLIKMPAPAWKFYPHSALYWFFPSEVSF